MHLSHTLAYILEHDPLSDKNGKIDHIPFVGAAAVDVALGDAATICEIDDAADDKADEKADEAAAEAADEAADSAAEEASGGGPEAEVLAEISEKPCSCAVTTAPSAATRRNFAATMTAVGECSKVPRK